MFLYDGAFADIFEMKSVPPDFVEASCRILSSVAFYSWFINHIVKYLKAPDNHSIKLESVKATSKSQTRLI